MINTSSRVKPIRLDDGNLRIVAYTALEFEHSDIAESLLRHEVYHPYKAWNGLYYLLTHWQSKRVNDFVALWVAMFQLPGDADSPIGIGCISTKPEPLVQLYVRRPYRRQGLGTQLLHRALSTGKAFKGAYTDTSQGLYTAAGIPNICSDSRVYMGSGDEPERP